MVRNITENGVLWQIKISFTINNKHIHPKKKKFYRASEVWRSALCQNLFWKSFLWRESGANSMKTNTFNVLQLKLSVEMGSLILFPNPISKFYFHIWESPFLAVEIWRWKLKPLFFSLLCRPIFPSLIHSPRKFRKAAHYQVSSSECWYLGNFFILVDFDLNLLTRPKWIELI